MNMSKFFLSLFYKANLAAFRAAILDNDTNRICRILDIEREHICKVLDNAGNTALLLAIQFAAPITVHVLLEQGAQADQTNSITFQTPLNLLVSTVHNENQCYETKKAVEMATMLLDHGAYVDKPSPYVYIDQHGKEQSIRETPLMTAVRKKNLSIAKLLVDRKANVNYCEKHTEYRPIHFSIINGDTTMFDLLENAGASCDSVVTKGENTLLHWFCYNKENDEHMSLLRKLIHKECDVNAENTIQRTPLMLAARSDMINTCRFLLTHSADIDKVDYQGNRAIDMAKIGSESFKLLEKIEQKKSRNSIHVEHVIWRKQIQSTSSLTKQRSGSNNPVNLDETKIKRYSSIIYDHHLSSITDRDELDNKYKRVWEKLLQTKHKIRRTRDPSSSRSRHYSLSRKRDQSQQQRNDSFDLKTSHSVEL